ncbi:pseudouridine-5'-phosphate glycosidase [Pontibacillus marinus]|uniref:Pseudouridine-5'-phosphate glycosidase n=1 Tax=Pontibacillus marinus BH030004 = DSM 16465 TaxID=1385511 RepID=A0A0A5G2V3_9BACI|nr:pseudouridine-5'-phosphate glycosidase [Pontibacillus marinus]KGX87421.1 pseudouridine-5'-phosphate glycosidase [Pontibacillus marinus BH030004 = DSM 16465]
MKLLRLSDEIQEAIIGKKPIVALESTIISHGMPYPENVEMAHSVEEIIREEGAVPATIAVLDGYIKVGLSHEEIERLSKEEHVVKTSIRDLPGVLTKHQTGATTVATTSYAAKQAGIRFFATGGLGGVHRGVAEHLDISNDLVTLAQSNMCVFSAGVKSILDVPKTLEMLETLGVPVYGYETTEYPGFYTRESGINVESITQAEIAELMKTKDHLVLNQSVHIAVPAPEQYALSKSHIQKIINESLTEADEQGITGKQITPFLLSSIKEKTDGDSLKANIELVKNNARIAAQTAVKYHSK